MTDWTYVYAGLHNQYIGKVEGSRDAVMRALEDEGFYCMPVDSQVVQVTRLKGE